MNKNNKIIKINKFSFIFIFLFINFKQIQTKTTNINNNRQLFPVSIIHINDFHARFEETNLNSVTCKTEISEKCIGGYGRVITMIKQLKLQLNKTNPIYLNAGDNFQGTLWYNILGWNVTSHFLNLLPADAITLGNHEFDNHIEGVVPFLKTLKSPVVVVNIDDSKEPTIQNLYVKSHIIDKYEMKIAVIGVILQTTNEIASTGNLLFLNESISIKNEAQKLKDLHNIKIIIVLSHCGLDVDKIIAANAGPNIDVIVGGHSHTFMYTGTPPGPDKPLAEYPEVVIQNNGRKVLIVQASAFTKYLGNLTVYFDVAGEVVNWEGAPIYLDTSIIPDPDIINEMIPWKEDVDAVGKEVIGENRVFLSKHNCNTNECNVGNYIVDAYVYSVIDDEVENKDYWTVSTISFTNAGGIRASLNKGIVNYGDLIAVTPFYNTLDLFDLSGNDLYNTLEYSVSKTYDDNEHFFAMLQVSGLKIIYNITKPIGERVINVDVLCRKCRIPVYLPLNKTETYRIITTSFLANGGDGFFMLRDNKTNHKIGKINDINALINYVKRAPITQGISNRITILK